MNKENEFLNKDNIVAIIGIIFFIVLVIIVRVSPHTEPNEAKTPKESPAPTVTPTKNPDEKEQEDKEETTIFDLIDDKNYHYIYNVTNNDKIEIIEGEKNSNKEIFSILGNQKLKYGKVGDNYLKYENGNYKIITEDIRNYFTYIDIDSIKEILSISNAKEEKEKIIFTIDITDLLDKYTEIEYSGFDEFKDDTVTVYCNENNQAYKIELDYSNYFTYVNKTDTIFKVTMEFDKFGLIKELEI